MTRLFVLSKDGSATKVVWTSECTDKVFDPCDLYERALHIEAADYLPLSFQKNSDGTFMAAISPLHADGPCIEHALYALFDLSPEQKECLQEFALFVGQTYPTIKAIRLRSFHSLSKVRIWRRLKQATGRDTLNACEREVYEALRMAQDCE